MLVDRKTGDRYMMRGLEHYPTDTCFWLNGAAGKYVQIETNGTNRLPDGCSIDWITCSPKYRPVNLNRIDELKVVFMGASQDMSRYDGMEASVYSLQPCDTGDGKANARILEETIAYCLANPKWRLSLQTHKIINVR